MDQPQNTTTQHRGLIDRFLNDTPPSRLLVWCFITIALAAICGVARVSLQTGMSWSESQQFYDGDMDSMSYITPVDIESDRSGMVRLKGFVAFVLGIGTFMFGIIGGLLPMWTVGRLISDAINAEQSPS